MTDVESLAKYNAVKLMTTDDAYKAARYIFNSVQHSLDSGSTEDKAATQKYVTKIMEIVSEFDPTYAEEVAIEYLRLLKASMPS
jgi:hypothetical protein